MYTPVHSTYTYIVTAMQVSLVALCLACGASPALAQLLSGQSASEHLESGRELFADSGFSGAGSTVFLQRTSARELNPFRLAPHSARRLRQQEEGISVEQQLAFELLAMTSGNALPAQTAPPLQSVTLEEAVRETMQREINLKLSEQDLQFARASRQRAAGEFDLLLYGNASHGWKDEEVTFLQRTALLLAQTRRLQVVRVIRDARQELARDIRELERGGAPEDPVDFGELLAGLDELGFQIDFEGLNPADVGLDPSTELINQVQIEALREIAGGEASFQRLVELESRRRKEILGLYRLVDRILENFQEQQARDRRRSEGIAFVNNSKDTAYTLALERRFRNALTLRSGIEFTRTGKNGRNNPTTNRGKIFASLGLPVGRGSGQTVAFANERAAALGVNGAEWGLRGQATESVRRTVRAYWEVVAAQQRVQFLDRSISLAYELMRETDRRLQAARATAGENIMALARYQEVLAQRTGAERDLFAARRELSLAMGWAPELGEEATIFPSTSQLFAAPLSMAELRSVNPLELAKEATLQRPDLLRLQTTVESSRILRDAARRDRLPRSDFNVRGDFGVVDQGSEYERLFGVYDGNKTFAGLQISFDLEWPFGNNRALGEIAEREIEIIRQEIRVQDLERQITSRMLVAYSRLYTTLAEMRRLDLAYKSYAKALLYQQELFAGGRSTSGNLIEAEQRLTDAGQTLVNAVKQHNQALIDFNFESGNLLTHGLGPISINYANLSALPFAGEEMEKQP